MFLQKDVIAKSGSRDMSGSGGRDKHKSRPRESRISSKFAHSYNQQNKDLLNLVGRYIGPRLKRNQYFEFKSPYSDGRIGNMIWVYDANGNIVDRIKMEDVLPPELHGGIYGVKTDKPLNMNNLANFANSNGQERPINNEIIQVSSLPNINYPNIKEFVSNIANTYPIPNARYKLFSQLNTPYTQERFVADMNALRLRNLAVRKYINDKFKGYPWDTSSVHNVSLTGTNNGTIPQTNLNVTTKPNTTTNPVVDKTNTQTGNNNTQVGNNTQTGNNNNTSQKEEVKDPLLDKDPLLKTNNQEGDKTGLGDKGNGLDVNSTNKNTAWNVFGNVIKGINPGNVLKTVGVTYNMGLPMKYVAQNYAQQQPYRNFYTDYGKKSLKDIDEMRDNLVDARDKQLYEVRRNMAQRNLEISNNVRSAAVANNLMTAANNQYNDAVQNINNTYLDRLNDISKLRASTQLGVDERVMSGNQWADMQNRQMRQNYYNDMLSARQQYGKGFQQLGDILEGARRERYAEKVGNAYADMYNERLRKLEEQKYVSGLGGIQTGLPISNALINNVTPTDKDKKKNATVTGIKKTKSDGTN